MSAFGISEGMTSTGRTAANAGLFSTRMIPLIAPRSHRPDRYEERPYRAVFPHCATFRRRRARCQSGSVFARRRCSKRSQKDRTLRERAPAATHTRQQLPILHTHFHSLNEPQEWSEPLPEEVNPQRRKQHQHRGSLEPRVAQPATPKGSGHTVHWEAGRQQRASAFSFHVAPRRVRMSLWLRQVHNNSSNAASTA